MVDTMGIILSLAQVAGQWPRKTSRQNIGRGDSWFTVWQDEELEDLSSCPNPAPNLLDDLQ
jgi:hypothetical protein